MAKIIVGMSGGVDSAVAAYLLKEEGHEVIGLTLRTLPAEGEESRCCEIDDAREAARKIGIPYQTLNCIDGFRRCVVQPFIAEYLHGRTPNPCVVCNRAVKWEWMVYASKVMQADCIATGHYATVVQSGNGRWTVKTAAHAEKDQTYMLYRLTQEQLAMTKMPLGKYSKEEVRAIAMSAGIPAAAKPDSQEICFVPDGDYARFIEENAEEALPGKGLFVDESGNILGTHRGIIHYTVGQRRGLGLPLGYRAFVKEIRADRNEVIIAEEKAIYCSAVVCRDIHFMSIPPLADGETVRCAVKIRYQHRAQAAQISMEGADRLRVVFDEPVRAPAPGQSAVFYDADDCVAGGGIIEETAAVSR